MICSDLKEVVILLAQHPISREPLKQMETTELRKAYDLLRDLTNLIDDDEYSQYDYIQMARVYFNLAELNISLSGEYEHSISFYQTAFHFLTKGGFDLSVSKWVELFSMRESQPYTRK